MISEVAYEGKRTKKLGIEWVSYQMRQIYMDYNLPINPSEITLDEVRFFYLPLIENLCKIQKEMKKGG